MRDPVVWAFAQNRYRDLNHAQNSWIKFRKRYGRRHDHLDIWYRYVMDKDENRSYP